MEYKTLIHNFKCVDIPHLMLTGNIGYTNEFSILRDNTTFDILNTFVDFVFDKYLASQIKAALAYCQLYTIKMDNLAKNYYGLTYEIPNLDTIISDEKDVYQVYTKYTSDNEVFTELDKIYANKEDAQKRMIELVMGYDEHCSFNYYCDIVDGKEEITARYDEYDICIKRITVLHNY